LDHISKGIFATLVLAASVSAEDWTRFRGPNGSGLSSETGIPAEFGPDKNVIWRTALPEGNSSPVFGRESIFVSAFEGDSLFTIAMDRQTGRVRWRREIVREREQMLRDVNTPASPSPVTDGENVYVFFHDFGLASYGPDGNERWRIPLGPFNNQMGMAASPILAGSTLIQVCDAETDAFILAVDKDSGKTLWRAERPSNIRAFSTPVLWEANDGGGLQLLVPGSYFLDAYSVATGEKIWWVQALSWQMKPTPVVLGDTIYLIAWSGGSDAGQQEQIPSFDAVIRYDTDKDGKLSPEEAEPALAAIKVQTEWRNMDLQSDGFLDRRDWENHQLKRSAAINSVQAIRLGGKGDMTKTAIRWQYYRSLPNVPSPLVHDGVLYMVRDGGLVTALDGDTGNLLKQGRLREAMDRYFSSPIYADGKIFMASEPGVISVLKPGRDWEVMQVNDLGENIYATPVVMDGRLYVRTAKALYCFDEPAS
jgi:outer membrane protein assembly factor BamB